MTRGDTHMRPTRTGAVIRAVAAIGGVLLLVSACSSSGASTAPSAPAAASTAPSAAASSGGGGTYTVAVANGTVGAYLTGQDGKTLYIFTPDSANKTTCTETRAQPRPPVTAAADDRPTGGTGA